VVRTETRNRLTKAAQKTIAKARSPKLPALAKAEAIDKVAQARMAVELDAALKRKPTSEAKLAGALRAMAPLSPTLRTELATSLDTLVKRKSFDRELYATSLRVLAEHGDKRAVQPLRAALAEEEGGGAPALYAAALSRDPEHGPRLAKLAMARTSYLAFLSEIARLCRGEASGANLVRLAPMIKEAHRISFCIDVAVPLVRQAPLPIAVAPALGILRGAERHLGRWLVLAELAQRAGDGSPRLEAQDKAIKGPIASRGAWALVHWALGRAKALAAGATPPACPDVRPSVELLARLSDRPSATKDMSFLFSMAASGAPQVSSMVSALGTVSPLLDEVSVRAAATLAALAGPEAKTGLVRELVAVAKDPKREELRGLAVAGLWDAGERDAARDVADEVALSKLTSNVGWTALVRAAARGVLPGALLTETNLRWIQWGWAE
jgi:hypothetical protein